MSNDQTTFGYLWAIFNKLTSMALLIVGLLVLLSSFSLAADGAYPEATFRAVIAMFAVLLARD